MTEKPSADKSADTSEKDLALPGKIAKALKEVPAEKRELVSLIMRQELSFFQGPLPPPEILAQYHEIDSGLSREFVEIAKREQQHDHKTEARGQFFSAAIAFAALVGGIVLIALDRIIFGGILSFAPIIGLAAVYIKSEFRARKPREK